MVNALYYPLTIWMDKYFPDYLYGHWHHVVVIFVSNWILVVHLAWLISSLSVFLITNFYSWRIYEIWLWMQYEKRLVLRRLLMLSFSLINRLSIRRIRGISDCLLICYISGRNKGIQTPCAKRSGRFNWSIKGRHDVYTMQY
jgi:hypothetical protein